MASKDQALRVFRDIVMTLARLKGWSYADLGAAYDLTPKTVKVRVQDMGSEMMRQAMANIRGDEDLEAFNMDSRKNMIRESSVHIERMYALNPSLTEDFNLIREKTLSKENIL